MKEMGLIVKNAIQAVQGKAANDRISRKVRGSLLTKNPGPQLKQIFN